MNSISRAVREAIERRFRCRIFRHSLPHGVDCFFDIDRKFGRGGVKVVFDVGANIGQSALSYLREFPQAQIYSFEPVAATYRELAAAAKPFPRIHAYNLGMGRQPGKAVIQVNPVSSTSSIVRKRPEDQPESINIETIAGFADAHHIECIDFLKVDTEGYDIEVLLGAERLLRMQQVHFIMVECEPVARLQTEHAFVDFTSLVKFLSGFGYQVFGVYDQQPEWDGRNVLRYWNALFICEKLIPCGSRLLGAV